ncbi:hypothetical protein M427DRAFT_51765 [Gonapodya prolifera JEL478]|uniref:Uncharacterized protein n=1 Tax=Gonapodya prolifera (strain JEL478) TaxID=1344416 RepID=A0A139AVR7_GONPJ|nr:hypothetical protein M427DRAFT_51765 [Gonapodya prolifera JEL478]|eukprot:KXS20807.1 hypothetical protein M427DRAFT_51765 [Gonapodya prolifera JEL478]
MRSMQTSLLMAQSAIRPAKTPLSSPPGLPLPTIITPPRQVLPTVPKAPPPTPKRKKNPPPSKLFMERERKDSGMSFCGEDGISNEDAPVMGFPGGVIIPNDPLHQDYEPGDSYERVERWNNGLDEGLTKAIDSVAAGWTPGLCRVLF